jgi:hypothetical protein
MAAAARNGDNDRALKEIEEKLANLQNRCRSPGSLERNIIRARADARDLVAAIWTYQNVVSIPALSIRAITAMIQNLEDRLEAFNEYVELRGQHTDDEHMMGRVSMAQFVRVALQDMIDYFDTISRH